MNSYPSDNKRSKRAPNIIVIVVLLLLILVTLAGMLLPSLSKAKSRAHRLSGPGLDLLYESVPSDIRYSSLPFNTESYDHIRDNPFLDAKQNPLSTFSIDVDTASYSNIRRFLTQQQSPPADAVRIEELLNYFRYNYPPPAGDVPFATHIEIADCPWKADHRLVRVGLKGKEIEAKAGLPCNLVFLIDVSGSMRSENKLPLLQQALELLVGSLKEQDRVAIVVYAGDSGLVLESTPCTNKRAILKAIKQLRAGGSTNGGAGIELAYSVATRHFIQRGVNRVILCTDGDFNVGVTSTGDLTRLIESKAKTGVFLTVLGFGMGNYKDATLERLADLGNGNYGYIDEIREAKKLLVEQLQGTLVTIAKDVKIQVEFNPQKVQAFRLIGYENRLLKKEDFNDDKKDAGEIGAGHTVTALYEIVPAGQPFESGRVDPLRYQAEAPGIPSNDMLTIKIRYKKPDGDESNMVSASLADKGGQFKNATKDFKFAAAVAAFGMLLRNSEHKGDADWEMVASLGSAGNDGDEYRSEFLELVAQARALDTAAAKSGLQAAK
jgi:Ca-activated chloride channel family protein